MSSEVTERPDITKDYRVTDAGCWEWLGYVDVNGYGKAYDSSMPRGRRVDWAHRVSYRRHHGPIAPRHEIDHECQNTRCINPDHLAMVTKLEHARRTMARLGKDRLHDAAARLRKSGLTYAEIADVLGYAERGSAARAVQSAIDKGLVAADDLPTRKLLDESDRQDIRAMYALGIPQTELAVFYGIDSSQASRICSGKSSGHSARDTAA